MRLTKESSVVSVPQTSEKKKQILGAGAFTSVKRALDLVAERVGSTVGIDESKTGVTFYLAKRPKDRQGRLEWNREVDRVSTLCRERMASYSPAIIVGRTGNQLELRRRNGAQ